jgi:hypothetical protein
VIVQLDLNSTESSAANSRQREGRRGGDGEGLGHAVSGQCYRQAPGMAGDAIMTGPGTNISAFGAAPGAINQTNSSSRKQLFGMTNA